MVDEPIASGRTADVYPWGDGEVLKLVHPWVPAEDVELERAKTLIAHGMGLPVPMVGHIVRNGERTGLVFERIHGPSMLEQLLAAPESMKAMARLLADLHRRIHTQRVSDESPGTGRPGTGGRLPNQKDVLAARISRCVELSGGGLSEGVRSTLLEAVGRLSVGDSLCHGDFHPGNVMMTEGGPVVIDWLDASRGNPLADVARTSLLLAEASEGGGVAGHQAEAIEQYRQLYVEAYFEHTPERRAEYEQWLPIVAAARLTEGIADRQQWLVRYVKNRCFLRRDGCEGRMC